MFWFLQLWLSFHPYDYSPQVTDMTTIFQALPFQNVVQFKYIYIYVYKENPTNDFYPRNYLNLIFSKTSL